MYIEYSDAMEESRADWTKEQAEKMPEFVPEVGEVREIAERWVRCWLILLWQQFRGGHPPAGTAEARIKARLAAADVALGEGELYGPISRACTLFPHEEDLHTGSTEMDEIAWDIFLHATGTDREVATLVLQICSEDELRVARDRILKAVHERLTDSGDKIALKIRQWMNGKTSSAREGIGELSEVER